MNINGCEVELKVIENSVIYEYIANSNILVPKVPTYEINGVERENLSHPIYNDSLMVSEVEKNSLAIEAMLTYGTEVISMSEEAKRQWDEIYTILKQQTLLPISDDENLLIKKYFIFRQATILDLVTNEVLLTEERVARYYNAVSVVRDGLDINKVNITHAVRTNIEVVPIFLGQWQLVNPVDEYIAAKESNIPWSHWRDLTVQQKANTIALQRIKKVIDVHSDDAVQIESERKSKKNK